MFCTDKKEKVIFDNNNSRTQWEEDFKLLTLESFITGDNIILDWPNFLTRVHECVPKVCKNFRSFRSIFGKDTKEVQRGSQEPGDINSGLGF